MGRRRKKPSDGNKGLPGWMATYSDLVTLLLAFFVMLMAMANFEDSKRVEAILASIREALGSSDVEPKMLHTSLEEAYTEDINKQDAMQPIYMRLQDALAEHVSDDYMRLAPTDKELRIRLREQVFFKPGSHELHPAAWALLSDVARILRDEEVLVRVEGHADQTGDERANWHVSSQRAVSVVMALRDKGPIAGTRLEAVGLGAFRPGSSIGEDPDWGRRVEIVLRTDEATGAAAADRLFQWWRGPDAGR